MVHKVKRPVSVFSGDSLFVCSSLCMTAMMVFLNSSSGAAVKASLQQRRAGKGRTNQKAIVRLHFRDVKYTFLPLWMK